MELVKASDYGLEETKVKGIEEAFAPKIAEREELNKFYVDIIKEELTPELSKKAGDLRRKLVKVRTGISEIHKTQKSFFLASGKFVDAWKNKETAPVLQMEEKLSEIEKYAENLEKERLLFLQAERIDLIKTYVEEIDYRNYAEMESDVWVAYLSTKKKSFDDKVKAEKEIEDKRIAEEKAEKERLAAIEKENAKLKAEAEAKEKQLKKERLKRDQKDELRLAAEQKEKDLAELKLKTEKAERERLEKIESDKQAAILKAEKEAREKLEAELKAKQDAEVEAKKQEEAKIEAELNKGDEAKIDDLISELNSLKDKYTFKSAKNKKIYTQVGLLIDKVTNHIKPIK